MPRALCALIAAVALMCAAGCRKERPADAPLRLAAFPNITHAQALVGNDDGTFERALGAGRVEVKFFNAGPAAMEALLSGSVDAAYLGSGPALNGFMKGGRELQVIASATDGGAVLVTRTAASPKELLGKKLAVPQVGNSQDIALRFWLRENGLEPGRGKDVEVVSVPNPDILSLFHSGEIEGAWVPEPWGARMLKDGGRLLVDERELWPGGRFPTTLLVTTRKTLSRHRPQLLKLIRAHVELTRRWEKDPQAFAGEVNDGFEKATTKRLEDDVLHSAFQRLTPSLRPDPGALQLAADHARALGYLPSADLTGLIDPSLLEEVIGAPAQGQGGAGP